jgi:hypothetical protein
MRFADRWRRATGSNKGEANPERLGRVIPLAGIALAGGLFRKTGSSSPLIRGTLQQIADIKMLTQWCGRGSFPGILHFLQ